MSSVATAQRFEYENMFRREMLRHLTGAETKTMLFLIDRSLGWMRADGRFTYAEMVEATGQARSTCTVCVDTLIVKHVIEVISSCFKRGTRFKLNLKWCEIMLKEPRNKNKNQQKTDVSCPAIGQQLSGNRTASCPAIGQPIYNKGELTIPKKKDSGTQATAVGLHPVSKPRVRQEQPDSIATAIEQATQRTTATRQRIEARGAAAAAAGVLTSAHLEAAWRRGIANATVAGAVYVAWTRKEQGQSKQVLKKVQGTINVLSLVEYAAANWVTIIRGVFPWARSEVENLPNIGFMLKYVSQFIYAFQNQKKIEAEASLSLVDVKRSRMLEQGVDIEEVDAYIDMVAAPPPTRARKHPDLLESYRKGVAAPRSAGLTPNNELDTITIRDVKALTIPKLGRLTDD